MCAPGSVRNQPGSERTTSRVLRLACASIWVILVALAVASPAGAEAEQAPDYGADLFDGEGSLTLADLRGSVVLLNVWATWCGPCKEEMPYLESVSQSFGGAGLRVVGVSIDRGAADGRVHDFLAETGATFTILRDEDNDLQRAFRTTGVPETILIDRDGAIVFRWKGALKPDSAADRDLIEATLAGRATDAADVARIAPIAIPVAFAAGLLSFLSPCVFPLVPTYAAIVTGIGLGELTSPLPLARSNARRATLTNGLLFVAGFSLVFIALGASATAVGEVLNDYRDWIARLGGVFLAILGLHLLGLVRLPFADREFRHHFDRRPAGYGGTFLIGVAFGAGWTPCIGPALASILTLTATSASIGEGMGLLAVYSLGLAVPFLIATVMLDRFVVESARVRHWLPRLERASGVLILVIAALLITDAMSRLAELGTWSPL